MNVMRIWGVLLVSATLALGVVASSASAETSGGSTATAAKKKCKKKNKKKCKKATPAPGGGGATPGTGYSLVGRWLGPAPNSTTYCPGTVLYTFDSAGGWSGSLVYADYIGCTGGNFTVGGTYTFSGSNLHFHFSYCPQACSNDADTTVTFINSNALTMSGVSGNYYRQ